jgi:hypothetical protein
MLGYSDLSIRNFEGGNGILKPLVLQAQQEDYILRATERNIVIKRRQIGMTTLGLATGFLIAFNKGHSCMSVMHTAGSADYASTILKVFANALATEESRKMVASVESGRVVFRNGGEMRVIAATHQDYHRAMSGDFLHLSELAWFSRQAQGHAMDIMESAFNWTMNKTDVMIESTPHPSGGGMFYEIWSRANELKFTRHFFPWWKEQRYEGRHVSEASMSIEESMLRERYGLSSEQIGWRRDKIQEVGEDTFKAEYGEYDFI